MAAILSAICEPLVPCLSVVDICPPHAALLRLTCQVNRLLVKRMTISQAKPVCFEAHLASGNGCQALKEMNFKLISNFFLTTFPTNMLLA